MPKILADAALADAAKIAASASGCIFMCMYFLGGKAKNYSTSS